MRLIDADAKMIAQLNDFETESVVEKEMTVDDYLSLSDYDAPTIDAVPVVRCKDCKWYEPPHILHDDGTKTYVDDGSPYVPASVGINVGGKCMNTLREYCLNHDREDPNDYEHLVKFRERMDFCSDGERKDDE